MSRVLALALLLGFEFLAHASHRKCEVDLLGALRTVNFQTELSHVDNLSGSVTRHLAELPLAQKLALDAELTKRHAEREMSFQVKNEATGFYDKFVAVGVNAQVAAFEQKDFERLVESTAPLMRSYRALLQKIYSKPNASVEELGLGALPRREAELAREIIYSSIYFEPALVNINMAEYPFLAVAGFDGAIVDPKHPTCDFFETNLGTPSGLSNNAQMLSDLMDLVPDIHAQFKDRLPGEDTFSILRDAVSSNARSWTGRDGLSVVISPGIYNGAHPDVAAISRLSGMPLVKSSDLYQDSAGWIRLKVVDGVDPVVTGIYGRMEDSYFLQSAADKIPMISPAFQDHSALAARLKLSLRPGAIYAWIYDEQGQIIDIERDLNGQPMLLQVWDTVSPDPARPEVEAGSFAQAIRARKLYYSALGGRVVDDKRLFRILTNHLLPRDLNLAHPVESLSPFALGDFYADPKAFVVKSPNQSGGSGIYFPRAMTDDAAQKLIERVKHEPKEFEIQHIATIATVKQFSADETREVPIDVRLFVMMDGNGNIHAGHNSLLIRTGAKGSLYTNTSRGGGYGIGLVLSQHAQAEAPKSAPAQMVLARSRVSEFDSLLRQSRETLACLKNHLHATGECEELALQLSFQFRLLLDLLRPNKVAVINELRHFAHSGEILGLEASLLKAVEDLAHNANPILATQARHFLANTKLD